ncbi:MAG: lactate racemase domain-containing protein, partial [Planctomycetia bacterium]
MRFDLQCGSETISLDVPDARLAGRFRGPEGAADFDPGAAVERQLANPVGAPPNRQAVVAGDRAVVVVDDGLPEAPAHVAPVLRALLAAGVAPPDVTFLLFTLAAADRLRADLRDALGPTFHDVVFAVHDPDDEAAFAYLSTTQEGRRVYLNRMLPDADTLFALGRCGYDPVVGVRAVASDVYPALSDAATLRRSRQIALEGRRATDTLRLRQGCDEVGWLVGLYYGATTALDRQGRPIAT